MKKKLPVKIKKSILIAVSVCITVLSISSCYYDKEEILFPQSVCDTGTVSFSRSVVPILSSNCTSCHGGNTPSGGIRLDTYAGTKVQAANGKLFGAVSHAAGFSPMPKNSSQLGKCNLTQIKKWIDAGAPDN